MSEIKRRQGHILPKDVNVLKPGLQAHRAGNLRCMTPRIASIRLDTKLAGDAVKALGAKSRSEAVHIALRE